MAKVRVVLAVTATIAACATSAQAAERVPLAGGSSATGEPWTIAAYSCGGRGLQDILVQALTPAQAASTNMPYGDICRGMRNSQVPPLAVYPYSTWYSQWGSALFYGLTPATTDEVEIVFGPGDSVRTATQAIEADLARRAGLPSGTRLFVHQRAGFGGAGMARYVGYRDGKPIAAAKRKAKKSKRGKRRTPRR